MKKTYTTPKAEKITFNYREQVVAASGGNSCLDHVRTIFSDACNIQSMVVLGYDICDSF